MARVLILLVLVLSLVSAGCAEDQTAATRGSGGAVTDPDRPVSSPDDGPTAAPPDGGATRVALPALREVRDGVQDAAPRPFEHARADETDGSLHVVYWTGVEPCAVLGDVVVEATDQQVTVTLLEGHLPEDGQVPACIEIAEEVAVRIPLDAPLEGRTLVDGATGQAVPVDVIEAGDAAAS